MAKIRGNKGLRVCAGGVLTASCLLLASCGEFSFKRGAGVADLEMAKRQCAAESGGAGLAACLKRQGWIVGNLQKPALDEDEPVLRATYREDPRGPAAAEPSATAPASKTPANQPAPPPVASNPLDIYRVNSWWKAGGSPAALEADTAQCVRMLGEAHRPDRTSGNSTRGLLHCMRGHGWYALQAD